MTQLYLILTLSFETQSAFRVLLPLHFEDSGKSLLSKWSKNLLNTVRIRMQDLTD